MMEPALLVLWIVLIGAVTGFLATWLGVGGCFLRIPRPINNKGGQ